LLILVDDKEAEAIALGAAPLPAECFTTHQAIVERLKEMVEESDRILFQSLPFRSTRSSCKSVSC
jgi:UDP-N-acetylmuramoyl-tripeptide--D-alanyl-D-alanine ligase